MRTASRALAVAGAAWPSSPGSPGQHSAQASASSPARDLVPTAQTAPLTQALPLTGAAAGLAGGTAQDPTDAELALVAPELGDQAAAAPGARLQRLARVGGRTWSTRRSSLIATARS